MREWLFVSPDLGLGLLVRMFDPVVQMAGSSEFRMLDDVGCDVKF
jgi:hypothetical protein